MARYDDDDDEGHIDMRPLLRLMVWGTCAVVAVGGTVLAGRTDVGTARAKVAMATLRAAPGEVVSNPNNLLASRTPAPDANEQHLVEQIRTLTADRDRLAERVATLEHNVNDLTGSIAANTAASNGAAANAPPPEKTEAPPPAATAAPPAPATAAAPASAEPQAPPINVAASNDDQAHTVVAAPAAPAAPQPGVGLPADVPLPRPGPLATIQSYVNSTSPLHAPTQQTRVAAAHVDAPPPQAATNGFAIDLGSATNVNTLRAHWGSVKAAHGTILTGLQPLVSVRKSTRPGYTEFHLVAGPVADADAAARLCAALTSVRVPCRPSTFNGQRLDLR
jgi:hypothetical protein